MINIDNYLRINPVDMIMVLVSTLLIVVVARKFFWRFLKDYLDKRHQFIQNQFDEALEKKKIGDQYCESSRIELAKIQKQSKEILEMSKANAEKEAERIIAEAKKNAEMITERTRTQLEQERIAAIKEMKQEMTVIALAAAEKIIKKELNDKAHRRFVKEFIDKAGEGLWQA